jgi:hypothetical protein
MDVGFSEVSQAVGARVGGELMEPDRLPDVGQDIVEQQVVRRIRQSRCLLTPQAAQEFARALHRVAAIEQHVTQDLPLVLPRVRVVADECDTLRRQPRAAQGEQAIAHILRHPGVDAVRHDVIELALRQVAQIHHPEIDVGEGERAGRFARRCHGPRRQIDPHEAALRQRVGERDDVAA